MSYYFNLSPEEGKHSEIFDAMSTIYDAAKVEYYY